ncbi:hypothetical protein [Campylobacter showae]|jgi:hypothetical protein|uniref:hypothetical protein n=1 Tax=Campylobacter showae TaxID=204 RepID=UPI000F099DDA|nr:hypothetical protein [Campylobacter showae]
MLILTNSDRPTTKEGFNALIRQNNGGSNEVSEQVIYNVGYLVYCSNIYALRQLKGSENARLDLLADKMILQSKLSELEQACRNASRRWAEVSDEAHELHQELIKLKSKLSQRCEQ